jgi:hypothetical protein
MGSKSTKVPKPKQMDYAKEGGKYLSAMGPLMAQTQALEAQYRPGFTATNLAEMGQYTAGLQDIQNRATQEAQNQLTSSKAGELASMTSLTGQTRGFLEGLSPEGAARVQQAQNQAMQAQGLAGTYQGESQGYINQANIIGGEAFARRGYLSPEQMRESQQQARMSAQAAGRVGGNLGIAQEIMNRESALAGRRAEATSAGANAFNQFGTQQNMLGNLRGEAQNANQSAYNLGSSFYTQPGLALLGQPSQAYNAGQQYTQYGTGLLGRSTPQLVNPDTGINLGAAYQQNVLAAQSAQAQANAARSAGMMGAAGQLGGAAITGAALI